MPSKIQFDRAALRQRIDQHFEFEKAQVADEIAKGESDRHLHARLEKWRADAEDALSDVLRRLDDISDYELAQFELPPLPQKPSSHTMRNLRARLERLQTKHERSLTAIDSLFGVNGGAAIELSAAQLRDFFGVEL